MTMFIDHGRAVVAEIFLLSVVHAILLIAVVDLNLIAVARALDPVGGYPLNYPLDVFCFLILHDYYERCLSRYFLKYI